MFNCKRMILTALCAVLALSLAGVASAQNVIINGDFETGDLTGWSANGESGSSSITVESGDNGPALPGTHNAYLANYAEAIGLNMKQTTPVGSVSAGTVFYSFDLKLDEAAIGGVFFVEIFAEAEGIGIVGGSGLMGPFWPWNAWESYDGSFEAPANADFLTIQFVATTGAAVGSNCVAHVDNVDLNQGVVANDETSLDSVKALFR